MGSVREVMIECGLRYHRWKREQELRLLGEAVVKTDANLPAVLIDGRMKTTVHNCVTPGNKE